jgi:uncharacterized membrane protein YozB (DUF420 family)
MPYASNAAPSHRATTLIGVLVLIVAAFLAYSVPPYLRGDTRVSATFALHYPLLVAHVVLGSIAMVCAVAQMWPALRRRRRRLHRVVGRVYVGSAVPAALCALVIGALTPFGPLLAVSNVALALLWLWCTVSGWRAGRQRRYDVHRRQMLRSGVLTLSIIANRIWTPLLFVALAPLRDSVFGGNEEHFLWMVAGTGAWLGWLLPMLALHWWLTRRPVISSSSISRSPDRSPV